MTKRFPLSRTASLLLAACAGLASASVQADALSTQDRDLIFSDVDQGTSRMDSTADALWHYAELGFLETRSTARLQDELKRAGFKVEAGVAGMPTAFVATAGTSDGPVIALLAEFDALPGFSQSATPVQEPEKGMTTGHACGHNLFGAGSVGAAIAIKKWLEQTGTHGQIRVYGSPAEEGGSGKVYLVRAGLFKDVDLALHWHPSDRNSASQAHSLANVSGKFRFYGRAAHASVSPEAGRSALDAVEAMDNMVNMMREHVPQETRIHYVITDGGQAPNVVPAFAESYYYVRNPDPETARDIWNRVTKAAEGAAMGTGTQVKVEVTGGSYSTLPNDTLGHLMDSSLRQVGGPQWDAKDTAFAEKVQASLGKRARPLDTVQQIEPYSSGEVGYYSSDVGDVSWAVPTAGLGTATWVPGTPAHSWEVVAVGDGPIGMKGMVTAAKTLALTAVTLYRNPETIAAAKAEFEKARGSDFEYHAMLGDRPPALDYRLKSNGKSAD